MPIRMTGLNSGLDTEAIIQSMVSAYGAKKDKYVKAQTKLSWKQDAWKSLNTKIYSLYDKIGKMRYSDAYNMKSTTVSDTTKAKVTAGGSSVIGSYTLKIDQLAKAGYLTGGELDKKTTSSSTLKDLGYTGGSTTLELEAGDKKTRIEVDGNTSISDVITKLNEAGVKASYDSKNQRIYVASKETGEANDFKLSGNKDVLSALKLTDDQATRVKAQDALIYFNGAKYTSSENSFEINGLTIEALAETGDNEISIMNKVDTQGIYDKIKDFMKDYNELMTEMSKLYNADSAKGYEPLTTDEKDSMTDTQIEEWEKKIKDSILRRDSTLDGIMSTMKTNMAKSHMVNGKSFSLASFGIATLGLLNSKENAEGTYHIDGNKDDEDTKGKSDKLMAAIVNDPDSVIDFMKQMAMAVYNALDTKMRSTSLSSAYKVYNDKQMAKEYSDYTTAISKWEKKITEMEDSYYKKFAAMESALAKLQSSTSSLTNLFGG